MAEQGNGCEFGDCPKQFNHMITTLNPPSTVTLCDDHYGPGLIPIVGAELGIDPMEFYAAVEKIMKAEQRKADKALAEAQAAEAAEGSQGQPDDDNDPHDDYDPGPEVDDQGGMSEVRYPEPAP